MKQSLLPWFMAVVTFAGTMGGLTAWSFQTFETKERSKENKQEVIQRLDRIESKIERLESKIDQIIMRR